MASPSSATYFVGARLGKPQIHPCLKTNIMFQRKNGNPPLFPRKKSHALFVLSVLDQSGGKVNCHVLNHNHNTHNNDPNNALKDPAGLALDGLFLPAQKPEQKMTDRRDINLCVLESDLQANGEPLEGKEEQLTAAERDLTLYVGKVNRFQTDLGQREKKIVIALVLQTKLEEELKKSRGEFYALSSELAKTKLVLMEREQEIFRTQQALASKEAELEMLSREVIEKDEHLAQANLNLRAKDNLLIEANQVIIKQQNEIKQLQLVLVERENNLMKSEKKRKEEEGKIKKLENNLEKRWVAWLVAQQEMKKLVHEVSKYQGKALAAEKELKVVSSRLYDLKNRLMSSQRSIETSSDNLRAQENQFEQQLNELFTEKSAIESYEARLRDAQLEVENEREKFRLAEQQQKGLEYDLFCERKTVDQLKAELQRDKTHLQQTVMDVRLLENELEKRTQALNDTQASLRVKESELVATRLEMHKLNAELASMQVNLKDKGNDLDSAHMYMEELHEEMSQLKALMGSKEDKLVKATHLLEEKKEKMNMMQLDFDNNEMKLSQANLLMKNIADLTAALAGSEREGKGVRMDEDSLLIKANYELFAAKRALVERELEIKHFRENSAEDMKRYQQRETDIEALKELLKEKEKEILAARRALAVKDEELKVLLNRWEDRETEIMTMREEVIEEANGLNTLHATVQNRIGNKTLGELAVEKLELEAAKLDVEAGMHALRNLVNLSNELVRENKVSLEVSSDNHSTEVNCHNETNMRSHEPEESLQEGLMSELVDLKGKLIERDAALEETKKAVSHLTNIAKQLIAEA